MKRKNYWKTSTASIIILLLTLTVNFAHAAKKENNLRAPEPYQKQKKTLTTNYQTSVPKIVFGSYVRFFQKFISPVDGPRCQMYPTCSQYGREAIRKHGAFIGFIMSADRLMRDNSGIAQHYPLIRKYNRFFYFDPISANDFWLLKNEAKLKN